VADVYLHQLILNEGYFRVIIGHGLKSILP